MRTIKFRAWDKGVSRMMYDVAYIGKSETEMQIVMQFTGLKDKNGKEIYEGDIATHRKAGDFNREELVSGEVIIEPSRGVVIGGWPAAFDIEVIGNIYENPDLLK